MKMKLNFFEEKYNKKFKLRNEKYKYLGIFFLKKTIASFVEFT